MWRIGRSTGDAYKFHHSGFMDNEQAIGAIVTLSNCFNIPGKDRPKIEIGGAQRTPIKDLFVTWWFEFKELLVELSISCKYS